MNILIIGSGGREHALAWKVSQSKAVNKIFVAPGNAGTALLERTTNVPIYDIKSLLEFAQQAEITLTVVGPEAPLAAGVVDVFRAAQLAIFGPSQKAAQLESSKHFAKQFMLRHHIPTARYVAFSDAASAHAYVTEQGAPIVIKTDGLAAGKGVVVAESLDEAHSAIDNMLSNHAQGQLLIEEYLQGEEASFIVMVDGHHVLPLATSQDHKRLGNGDLGPNTGGMGAYSPAPIISPHLYDKVLREIIDPVVKGMAAEGMPYTGFLYAGLMINARGDIHTLEFNCRMGDPESQAILMRLNSDLVSLLQSAVLGRLNEVEAKWDPRFSLGVVMAAENYPNTPVLGDEILGLQPTTSEIGIFHAGTENQNGLIVSSGGRVLCVTALGDTVASAQSRAYQTLRNIHFRGAQYRTDIGYRAISRTL
ncbi:MAG: phosphoribosylamine--glycine ligase [Methylophilaceae bacterium]|nr:phosphoribosylamine--glycine ligase [Methylophilaceae bacterium]